MAASISVTGVAVYQSTACGVASSVGRPCTEKWMAVPRTLITGNREARVTMPKPASGWSPRPAEAATPMPRARTSGTVTGPVVMPPQSQARPSTRSSSGRLAA